MPDAPDGHDDTIRPGEVTVVLPDAADAGLYFVGLIRTPWRTRAECPRRGAPDGPICTIEIAPQWRPALQGLAQHPRIQLLYWMHRARRDLAVQAPKRTGTLSGTFALRSPVRPNPIASSIVDLVDVDEAAGLVRVRGLDCLDGTPLVDIKPDRSVDRR